LAVNNLTKSLASDGQSLEQTAENAL
jgi:hypothetical protein